MTPTELIDELTLLVRQRQDADALALWEREWPTMKTQATNGEELEIAGIFEVLDLEVVAASVGRLAASRR